MRDAKEIAEALDAVAEKQRRIFRGDERLADVAVVTKAAAAMRAMGEVAAEALALVDAVDAHEPCVCGALRDCVCQGTDSRLRHAMQRLRTAITKMAVAGDIATSCRPECPLQLAAAGSMGVECEHGFDVCPKCDQCTCNKPRTALARVRNGEGE
jgi:hypothetical protein